MYRIFSDSSFVVPIFDCTYQLLVCLCHDFLIPCHNGGVHYVDAVSAKHQLMMYLHSILQMEKCCVHVHVSGWACMCVCVADTQQSMHLFLCRPLGVHTYTVVSAALAMFFKCVCVCAYV